MEKGSLEERNEKIEGKSGAEEERIMDRNCRIFGSYISLHLVFFFVGFHLFLLLDKFESQFAPYHLRRFQLPQHLPWTQELLQNIVQK